MQNDTISRQAAIDAINTWDRFGVDERCRLVRWNEGLELYVRLRDVLTAIVNLPYAQPERKNGHWVEIGDEPYDEWECDVCGFVIDGSGCIDPEEYRDVYRFCPRCGSDMRGEQDE